MEAVDRFRVEPIEPERRRSRLIAPDGSFQEVEGQVLEMQFRCAQGFLVVTSDGNPYEETVHFYLLDATGQFRDGLSLGRMYHSGILSATAVVDETLEFSFFGTERWRLRIGHCASLVSFPKPFSGSRSIKGPLRRHYLQLERLGEGERNLKL
jgi:hypothetical protein